MGCTSGVMKCALNIMNIFMAIFGAALIALAVLTLDSAPKVYIYYLFIVGGVSFVTAMLGCCGICQEDICMTTTYAIIILGLLISQVVGKFYVTDSEGIRKFAANDVAKTWAEELHMPGAMNKTQQTYTCCGKDGPSDYTNIGRLSYPLSCYPELKFNRTALYHEGCTKSAEEHFVTLFNYSSSGVWTNLIFTAVMFLFAIYLVHRFRNKQRRYNY